MGNLNDNGSSNNGFLISLIIHGVIGAMVLFSGYIRELPVINTLIESRLKGSLSTEILESEPVSVTYADKKTKSEPLKKSKIKKVTKALPKKVTKTVKKEEPLKKSPAVKSKSPIVAAGEIPLPPKRKDINKNDSTNLDGEPIDNKKTDTAVNEAINESVQEKEVEYIKNPNPPSDRVEKTTKQIDGFQDGRSLKQLKGNPQPEYPKFARLNKQEGTTLLRYDIDFRGSVSNVRLDKSSGFPELDDEAIRKVEQWKFKPGQAGETIHPIVFKLKGPTKRLSSRLRTK